MVIHIELLFSTHCRVDYIVSEVGKLRVDLSSCYFYQLILLLKFTIEGYRHYQLDFNLSCYVDIR